MLGNSLKGNCACGVQGVRRRPHRHQRGFKGFWEGMLDQRSEAATDLLFTTSPAFDSL